MLYRLVDHAPSRPALIAVLCAFSLLLAPSGADAQIVPGCEDCPPVGAISSPITGAQGQIDRPIRDGVASTCAGETFPGTSGGGASFFYESLSYRNFASIDTCITVAFDPSAGANPCGPNGFATAYLGTYDPANPSVGYLGDVGSSVAQSFSFTVPAESDYSIVLFNTVTAASCDAEITLSGATCQADFAVCVVPPIPTMSRFGTALLAILLAGLSLFVLVRRP